MRQQMVVIGDKRNFGCFCERREFPIVRIFDKDKVPGIDTARKFSLRSKEISELILTQGRNSSQHQVGLPPGRLAPNQLKAPLPDCREDMRRRASCTEPRGYEDIGVDDNSSHSDFIRHKLAKIPALNPIRYILV